MPVRRSCPTVSRGRTGPTAPSGGVIAARPAWVRQQFAAVTAFFAVLGTPGQSRRPWRRGRATRATQRTATVSNATRHRGWWKTLTGVALHGTDLVVTDSATGRRPCGPSRYTLRSADLQPAIQIGTESVSDLSYPSSASPFHHLSRTRTHNVEPIPQSNTAVPAGADTGSTPAAADRPRTVGGQPINHRTCGHPHVGGAHRRDARGAAGSKLFNCVAGLVEDLVPRCCCASR